jgi:hypothetical protein
MPQLSRDRLQDHCTAGSVHDLRFKQRNGVAKVPYRNPLLTRNPPADCGTRWLHQLLLQHIGQMRQRPRPCGSSLAGDFALLSKAGISTVPQSTITGDIGCSPIAAEALTGFTLTADSSNAFSTSTQIVGGGKAYAANFAVPTPFKMTTAIRDMETAYVDAAGRTNPTSTQLVSGLIGGLTLEPGLYKCSTNVLVDTDATLDGGSDDVWIFQISGNLMVAPGKKLLLSGGALAKNIFWQVAGFVEVMPNAEFQGILLSKTGVSFRTGASHNGRVLAQTAIVLQSATITQPE